MHRSTDGTVIPIKDGIDLRLRAEAQQERNDPPATGHVVDTLHVTSLRALQPEPTHALLDMRKLTDAELNQLQAALWNEWKFRHNLTSFATQRQRAIRRQMEDLFVELATGVNPNKPLPDDHSKR